MPFTPMQIVTQPGLAWKKGLFGAKPVWTKEPSKDIVTKLAKEHLELSGSDATSDIEFFTEGAFNKLYAITCSKGRFIFRVTLPVAPKLKTLSVATLAFIRGQTSIPVPKLVAYDADLTNELGFEWILMDRLNGRPLREKWHKLSWLKKGRLVQQIAAFTAQLSRIRFSGILSRSPESIGTVTVGNLRLCEAIQPPFFMEDHIRILVPRGPFVNSHALVTAHLQHLQHDIKTQLASDDEDEVEDAEEMQDIYNSLAPIIPQLFPPEASNEQTFLYHPDLSSNNILVNDNGDLVGIVDWECVITAPSWLSSQLLQFLEGPSRPFLSCPEPLPAEFQSDEDAIEAYEEQLLAYETAQLRRLFLEEMARIQP